MKLDHVSELTKETTKFTAVWAFLLLYSIWEFICHCFRNSVRVAQYVNRYMDELLRRADQRYTDEELEEKISASIVLFKYIEEKDLFKQVSLLYC